MKRMPKIVSVWLDPKLISPIDCNPDMRVDHENREWQDLHTSLNAYLQIQPVHVIEDPNDPGYYICFDGNRRVDSVNERNKGLPTAEQIPVSAIIWDFSSAQIKKYFIELNRTNAKHKTLHYMDSWLKKRVATVDKARLFRRLVDHVGMDMLEQMLEYRRTPNIYHWAKRIVRPLKLSKAEEVKTLRLLMTWMMNFTVTGQVEAAIRMGGQEEKILKAAQLNQLIKFRGGQLIIASPEQPQPN